MFPKHYSGALVCIVAGSLFEEIFQRGALGGGEAVDPHGLAAGGGRGDGPGGARADGLARVNLVLADGLAELVAERDVLELVTGEALGVALAGVAEVGA